MSFEPRLNVTQLPKPLLLLYDVVYDICEHPDPRVWEVDPDRLDLSIDINKNQNYFIQLQSSCLNGVTAASQLFPAELATLFFIWKKRCAAQNISHLFPRLVSSSLFLRLICPAILSPTLFGLRQDLPDSHASRVLTLTAKVMLNLANVQKFSHKEPYMEFMNQYIDNNTEKMESFIFSIAKKPISVNLKTEVYVDTGLELAFLHEKFCKILKPYMKPVEPIEPVEIKNQLESKLLDSENEEQVTESLNVVATEPILKLDPSFANKIFPLENILTDLTIKKSNPGSKSPHCPVISKWYSDRQTMTETSNMVDIFSTYHHKYNRGKNISEHSPGMSASSSDERDDSKNW